MSDGQVEDYLTAEKENTPPNAAGYPELDLNRHPFRRPLTNLSSRYNVRTELQNLDEAVAFWDDVDFVDDWVF